MIPLSHLFAGKLASHRKHFQVMALTLAGAWTIPGASALPATAPIAATGKCDPIDPSYCMFPFPNDYYTVADPSTATGLRVNLSADVLPVSKMTGQHVDPSAWNRNDGFSPGSMILTRISGIDLVKSGAPLINDTDRSLQQDSPILLVDASTLEKQRIWAEIDHNTVNPAKDRLLTIWPAKNLEYGHRYIVVLRNLRDDKGSLIAANPAFATYKAGSLAVADSRAHHMQALFKTLDSAGIKKNDLYLAWDFTVASEKSIAGSMLEMRDDAFAPLSGKSPRFSITKVRDLNKTENPWILREVEGIIEVPDFMHTPAASPQRHDLDQAFITYIQDTESKSPNVAKDLEKIQTLFHGMNHEQLSMPGFNYASKTPGPYETPLQSGQAPLKAEFLCKIPRSVMGQDGATNPATPTVYGHGFFGSIRELDARNIADMTNEHNFVYCATRWSGFAREDVLNAMVMAADKSYAPGFYDAIQQGFLNQLYLARTLATPDGLASAPAFHVGKDGKSAIDPSSVVYDGNSQGGILGGAILSLSTDIHRGVLGVTGMNYSLLSDRSADGGFISNMTAAAYPQYVDRKFLLSLSQMLFDRADSSGYAQHMTTMPFPGTPAHQVLMHVGYGDHQVTMVSAEVEARTIGAKLHCPALASNRLPDKAGDISGIECLDHSKDTSNESALVIWDSGPATEMPPAGNMAPAPSGHDPHEDVRSTVAAREQKAEFLKSGKIIDVCAQQACMSKPIAPDTWVRTPDK